MVNGGLILVAIATRIKVLVSCTKSWAPRSWLPNPGCRRAALRATLPNHAEGIGEGSEGTGGGVRCAAVSRGAEGGGGEEVSVANRCNGRAWWGVKRVVAYGGRAGYGYEGVLFLGWVTWSIGGVWR